MSRLKENNSNIMSLLFSISISFLINFIGCNDQIKTDPDSKVITEESTNDTLKYNRFVNGKKDGIWRTYHASGKLKSEGEFLEDLKEGLHKEWQPNGILLLEGYYSKGKANGMMKWFHDKGHLAGAGNMVDDTRQGEWKICDIEENGFCIDAFFENGKRAGVWKIYHEAGSDKVWKEQTFKEDRIVAEKCWDEKGTVIVCIDK